MSDKKQSRIDLTTFFIASIISFVSIYDTFLKMLTNFEIKLSTSVHVVLAIAFMLVCFVLPTGIKFYYDWKKIKKIDKDVKYLEKLICDNETSSVL